MLLRRIPEQRLHEVRHDDWSLWPMFHEIGWRRNCCAGKDRLPWEVERKDIATETTSSIVLSQPLSSYMGLLTWMSLNVIRYHGCQVGRSDDGFDPSYTVLHDEWVEIPLEVVIGKSSGNGVLCLLPMAQSWVALDTERYAACKAYDVLIMLMPTTSWR